MGIKSNNTMPRTKKVPSKPKFTFTVGKRKESIARIRLFAGKGETVVNSKPISEYFPGEGAKVNYLQPFMETETLGKYFVTARITGGGKAGQLAAFIHGVSRALAADNREKFRPVLKKKGLLTRDSRTRERRKVGMGGKARRKRQSPKR